MSVPSYPRRKTTFFCMVGTLFGFKPTKDGKLLITDRLGSISAQTWHTAVFSGLDFPLSWTAHCLGFNLSSSGNPMHCVFLEGIIGSIESPVLFRRSSKEVN